MYAALVLLPLAGSIIAGLFGRKIGDKASQLVTTGAVGLSLLFSVIAFFDIAVAATSSRWNCLRG